MKNEFISYIGFLAAFCTTSAFIPQLIKAVKLKHTKDISLFMYIIFVVGIIAWLVYGLFINDMPIILANIVSLVLSLSILVMKIKYK